MADEVITLEFLARLCQQTLQETRMLRREVAGIRTLSLQTIEYARRIEQRVGDVDDRVSSLDRRLREQRDDLELMIKAELGGSLANMQTQLENQLQPIQDKLLQLDKLEERVTAFESSR